MDDSAWTQDIDVRVPSAAGMVEHWLGGGLTFAADREAADQIRAVLPECRWIAMENRVFRRDAVAFMASRGVRQFLDIGAGLLTHATVHDIASAIAPGTRTVYVDCDPVVVAYNVDVLRDVPHTGVFQADLRYPGAILEHHTVRTMLDFSEPVGLLLLGVVPFLDDTEASAAVAMLRDSVAPGSYLAVSHLVREAIDDDTVIRIVEVYRRTRTPRLTVRSRAQILHCFAGLDLLEPGLVPAGAWLPDGTEPTVAALPFLLTGVARKPHPAR